MVLKIDEYDDHRNEWLIIHKGDLFAAKIMFLLMHICPFQLSIGSTFLFRCK